MGVILDIFFDSTAKTLVIYREFWYFFRIFPTLFSQLISIFMSLLHTFFMGVKTDARLPRSERFASIMRSRVLSASCGTRRRIRTITKMGVSRFEHYEFVDLFQPRGSAHFFNGSNTPALTEGSRKTPLRIMEANRSLLAKSRIDFHSHRECMEENHEYANELGKQGGKNPRKIPKFSINHERFSRTIEKKI